MANKQFRQATLTLQNVSCHDRHQVKASRHARQISQMVAKNLQAFLRGLRGWAAPMDFMKVELTDWEACWERNWSEGSLDYSGLYFAKLYKLLDSIHAFSREK